MRRQLTALLAVTSLTAACNGEDPARMASPTTPSSVAGPSSEAPPPPPRLIGDPPDRVLRTVDFSGYLWDVTHRPRGVGPTTVGGFSGRHAWVDRQGRLHLRLQRVDGDWQGGAVVSQLEGWGYGTYEWMVDSRIDGFHESAVVGFFTYEEGAPGNREIDIEIARFGRARGPRNMSSVLHYEEGDPFNQSWDIGAQEPTTLAFTWRPGWVTWVARDGDGEVIHATEAPTPIRPGDERVHMNMWICCDRPPDRPQHVVISAFSFTPWGAQSP